MRLKLQKRSELKLVSRIIPLYRPLEKGDFSCYASEHAYNLLHRILIGAISLNQTKN